MANIKDLTMKTVSRSLKTAVTEVLASQDFLSRSIGMGGSYNDIMFLVQALDREPVSLLGKDYMYIYDHVRRNYLQGTYAENEYNCPKFTFYKELPSIRFANPYEDNRNYLGGWVADMKFADSASDGMNYVYAESDDDQYNNRIIDNAAENEGTVHSHVMSYFGVGLGGCDLVKKTNDNFQAGKYRTLVSRFHTNSEDSKSLDDTTQTAVSRQYGMSHGRNLLSGTREDSQGYDNPYCRVWTNHHQYKNLERTIRPFQGVHSAEALEDEMSGSGRLSFKTIDSEEYGIVGGNKRLDKYGVLNYENGMVNIAPTAKISDYFDKKADSEAKASNGMKIVDVKKCMFSIENLAWKDTKSNGSGEYDPYGLSAEQRGPLGGRIMWFPPYELTFSEDSRARWAENQFIGRGENIYTYKNTERTGNLSFKLLIDHPSILDYWNRSNDSGTHYSVDDVGSDENKLLRFFAGCDILEARPQTYKVSNANHIELSDPSSQGPSVGDPNDGLVQENPTTSEETKPTSKVIESVLFFPNNYSGVDDGVGKVNAVHYLMNGIGAQKYVNDQGYAEDIPTTLDESPDVSGDKYGGYERASNISITTEPLESGYTTIESTFVGGHDKAQYLTSPSGGDGYVVGYGDGREYKLAKIIGTDVLTKDQAKNPLNVNGIHHIWYRGRWYYRVDNAYVNDKLSRPESYIDTKSFSLNAGGCNKCKDTVTKGGLPIEHDNKLIAFCDLFCGVEGDKNKAVTHSDETDVQLVKAIISEKERYKVTKIVFQGHASTAGRNTTNDTLARNRALTIKKWLFDSGFPKEYESVCEFGEPTRQSENSLVDSGGANSLVSKIWRSASVIIYYDEYAVSDASTAENIKVDDNGNTQVDKVEIPNKETSSMWTRTLDNVYHMPIDDKAKIVGQKLLEIHRNSTIPKSIQDILTGTPISTNIQTPTATTMVKEVNRYDNEGEFFETLTREAPFLHHQIKEKIKYFDPAFHSISPEGFNARLTFLHQCTRQGATVENSAFESGTAYNLAFGRPPVCVLRLGDFFNTKIVIDSLQISYEDLTWDLNPEGIGVMPMIAKISITFKFLGGSEMGGPIQRLQNAVSFNYYANTSIYDNRAERVEYARDGSGRETNFKPFVYPRGNGYNAFTANGGGVDFSENGGKEEYLD